MYFDQIYIELTMDKFKFSSFCVGLAIMVALLLLALLFIVVFLGKSEDDQAREVFFVILGIVVGILIVLMLVAVIHKLLCKGTERSIYKLPLPWNKGQNKLLRTADFSASDCCICLEEKGSDSRPVVKIMCDHEFHEKCISKSFSKDERCPKCRQIPGTYSSPERFKAYLHSVFIKKNPPMKSDCLHNNKGKEFV